MGQSQQTKMINAKMKAKEWQWEIKSEVKNMDKEIKKIQQQELKIQKEVKAQAEKNNVSTVQTLTRQIIRSRKAVKRLEKTKANLFSVDMQLTTAIATMSTTSSLQVSADLLAKMNKIANTEGVGASMEAMRKEMAKMGEAEEAVEDALRDSDEEEETATEMQKVMEEMALDVAQFGPLSRAAADVEIPQAPEAAKAAPPPKKEAVAVGSDPAPAPKAPQVQPAPVIPPPKAQPPADAPMGPAPTDASAPGPMAPAPSLAPGGEGYAAGAPPAAGGDAGVDQDELMRRLMCLKK